MQNIFKVINLAGPHAFTDDNFSLEKSGWIKVLMSTERMSTVVRSSFQSKYLLNKGKRMGHIHFFCVLYLIFIVKEVMKAE